MKHLLSTLFFIFVSFVAVLAQKFTLKEVNIPLPQIEDSRFKTFEIITYVDGEYIFGSLLGLKGQAGWTPLLIKYDEDFKEVKTVGISVGEKEVGFEGFYAIKNHIVMITFTEKYEQRERTYYATVFNNDFEKTDNFEIGTIEYRYQAVYPKVFDFFSPDETKLSIMVSAVQKDDEKLTLLSASWDETGKAIRKQKIVTPNNYEDIEETSWAIQNDGGLIVTSQLKKPEAGQIYGYLYHVNAEDPKLNTIPMKYDKMLLTHSLIFLNRDDKWPIIYGDYNEDGVKGTSEGMCVSRIDVQNKTISTTYSKYTPENTKQVTMPYKLEKGKTGVSFNKFHNYFKSVSKPGKGYTLYGALKNPIRQEMTMLDLDESDNLVLMDGIQYLWGGPESEFIFELEDGTELIIYWDSKTYAAKDLSERVAGGGCQVLTCVRRDVQGKLTKQASYTLKESGEDDYILENHFFEMNGSLYFSMHKNVNMEFMVKYKLVMIDFE